MKLITRDTDYALRSLCYILKQGRRMISVSELVEKLNIPRPFLRKILQSLNRERILKSHKGKGGGFMLARPGTKILLADLIETFQGPLKLNECFFKKLACPNTKTCSLRKKINSIEGLIIKELKSITITSLIR